MEQRSIYHLFAIWALLLLASLASCSNDDERPMPADGAIRFDNRIGESFVENLTRGIMTTKDNLTEFGVFSYYSEDQYNAASSTPNHMRNILVTRAPLTNTWTYTPLNYWPQIGSISFFAYTPYARDTDTAISVECITGAPVVTYVVPDEVTAHRDLMLSAPTLNQTKQNDAVVLTFHHALACIDFNAHVNGKIDEYQSIKVTAVRLGKFKNTASCNHESADGITQTFTEGASDKEYTLSEEAGTLLSLPLSEKDQQITSTNSCLMLWPQKIEDTDKLTITAEYTSNGKTREVVFEPSIYQYITEIKAGQRHIFNLSFSTFGKLTLTCTIAKWETESLDVPEFN